MEFRNRKLLLLNEDVPISPFPHFQNTEPMTPPPRRMYGSSLQLPPRPNFTSNLAYAFLILFTTVFILGFILLYIRQFSDNSSSLRRRHRSCGHATADTKPLPTLPYRGDSKPQPVECAICLDEFDEGETVKMIPHCKHVFHPECIDMWLVDHVTCPVCRCTMVCEVGKVECGSVENGEERGREDEVESEGALSESTVRGSGGGRGGGSRFRLMSSVSV